MGGYRLLYVCEAGIVLALVGVALLIAWRRRLPADFIGQVKADACLAMVRALLVLLAGLALALVGSATGPSAIPEPGHWLAAGLIVLGGVALLARVALYLLRIKPQLDRLAPTMPSRPPQRQPAPSATGTHQEGG